MNDYITLLSCFSKPLSFSWWSATWKLEQRLLSIEQRWNVRIFLRHLLEGSREIALRMRTSVRYAWTCFKVAFVTAFEKSWIFLFLFISSWLVGCTRLSQSITASQKHLSVPHWGRSDIAAVTITDSHSDNWPRARGGTVNTTWMEKWSTTPQHQKARTRRIPVVPQA